MHADTHVCAHQMSEVQFEELLARLRPHLLRLPPASPESRLCRLWLARLNRARDQPGLRDEHLLELLRQLGHDHPRLCHPFDKPPERAALQPIVRQQPMTSSSCNELTETSASPCEQKCSWPGKQQPRLRSRSLHHSRRSFDERSSSLGRSHNDEGPPSPLRLCDPDDRNLLRTYKERLEKLNNIVEELESQNDKLRQKLTYYQNASVSDEMPQLHARVRQLTIEINSLKNKLKEVYEIKEMMTKTHNTVVAKYKKQLTEQFDKMKHQLEKARKENHELNSKMLEVERKLEQLTCENEQNIRIKDKSWDDRMECVKEEYEKSLRQKDEEIRKRDDLVRRKELELANKVDEVESLRRQVEELQQAVDKKSKDVSSPVEIRLARACIQRVRSEGPDGGEKTKYDERILQDGKFQSILSDQFKSMKEELSIMRSNIECASLKQSESHQQDINALKKNLSRFGRVTQKIRQEYEEALYHILKVLECQVTSSPFSRAMGEDESVKHTHFSLHPLLGRFPPIRIP